MHVLFLNIFSPDGLSIYQALTLAQIPREAQLQVIWINTRVCFWLPVRKSALGNILTLFFFFFSGEVLFHLGQEMLFLGLKSKKARFIFSFVQYLLSTCRIPGALPGVGDKMIKQNFKVDRNPCPPGKSV